MAAVDVLQHDNITPARSIDPADEDFSDLTPLAEAVGEARVVMLGEARHGDGAAFLAKCRLVKFLHQKMGFDVLAWESGLLDCRIMDEAIRKGKPLDDPETRGIYSLWYSSQQVRPILEYAQASTSTTNRLEMAGFDHRYTATLFPDRFSSTMLRFFEASKMPRLTQEQREAIRTVAERVKGLKYPAPQERQECRDTLKMMLELVSEQEAALREAHGPREFGFHKRLIDNLLATEELYFSFSQIPKGDYATRTPAIQAVTERRDMIMGDNLVWLVDEYYPGRKIIVWAASGHTMRNQQTISTGDGRRPYRDGPTMGHEACHRLGSAVFSVAFTAYQGEQNWLGAAAATGTAWATGDIGVAEEGSWESLLHQAGFPYSFVPLGARTGGADDAAWASQPRVAYALGHGALIADWSQVFDGLFFIDVMTPSTDIASA